MREISYRDVVELYHELPEASRPHAHWLTSEETQEAFAMRRLTGLKPGMIPPFGNTLLGLPVIIDNTMEPETILLTTETYMERHVRMQGTRTIERRREPAPTLAGLFKHWWARARGRS